MKRIKKKKHRRYNTHRLPLTAGKKGKVYHNLVDHIGSKCMKNKIEEMIPLGMQPRDHPVQIEGDIDPRPQELPVQDPFLDKYPVERGIIVHHKPIPDRRKIK